MRVISPTKVINKVAQTEVSRRQFIKVSALSGVGFSIGFGLSGAAHAEAQSASEMGHFVKIAKDNSITVVIKHLDKGQGVTTGLTAIVAEEIDADWSQMRWEFAPSDPNRYNNLFWGPYQGTGGSTSIANSWMQLRQAGAAAKHMLISAAAKTWGVAESDVSAQKGMLTASGKSATYGEMAEIAALIAPPQEPKLKKPEEFTLIGTSLPRIDSKEKSTGKAQYTIDVRLPGMLVAAIARPEKFGATLKSVNSEKAKAVAGVQAVVETPRGVAVLAKNHWAARQGKAALVTQWDDSKAENRSSAELWADFKTLAEKQGAIARNDGDMGGALAAASETLEMEFEFPYLSHATMEPMNCVVDLQKDACHIYTGSQIPGIDQYVASQVTGVPVEKVFIHTQFAGGSFGRRAVPDSDFVMDAVVIAKAINGSAPVCLQWSREDDVKGGRYRPMAYHKFKAAIDANGEITGWHQRLVSQSILRGTPFEGLITGPLDFALVEGGANLPYRIPNFKFDGHEAQVGVPVLWWRSVGHSHNAYATEVFFDEVAHKAGKDPGKLRQELLKEHPRHLAVLNKVLEASDWGKSLPEGIGLGVAVHESFASFVAQVAQIKVNADKTFKVEKVWCAVDCGVAVTPDVVVAQMEGGIGYGLSAILGEAITLDNGKVQQNNFYDYTPLRINQMPDIEVFIIPSAEAPTGVGEPGTPPIGPAVANAIRSVTGKPITKLPIGQRV
ncbi:xanthine dehydrogenase family protein molybdopterin-binding subunit [Planctobacterium marinum]|uniref:Oxidoreductase n=1 Tax=Planctobacterium marinum TaxID=1631968 RepID=A0AA48KV30_9ALTE|nr:oxidoreductase [Planctobacterium marinum]